MENNAIVSKSMKLLFISQIVAIAAVFLGLIPVVGIIISLAPLAITVYALYLAGAAHPNYRTAMIMTAANFVATLLGSFFLTTLFDIVSTVLNFLVVYFICNTTAEFCNAAGAADVAKRGVTVWKLNFVCSAISVVCSVLMLIPVLNILGAAIMVITAIVMLVALILYIMFLWNAHKALA